MRRACSVLALLLVLPLAHAAVLNCRTVSSLIRDQFDRFILLQRRGPPRAFVAPYFASYISALAAFVADGYHCPSAFGPCCISPQDVDAFHAIHDRALVDTQIQALHAVDQQLFFLPPEQIADADFPPLTPEQDAEVNALWRVTQEALEDPPDSYVTVWSVLPEGLSLFYDPENTTVCAQFEAFKTGVPSANLITSVAMVHEIAALALRAKLLGVDEDKALHFLSHAVAFIFNGIRCERKQNEELLVPRAYYAFYNSVLDGYLLPISVDKNSIPEIPADIVEEHLADELRILSSYNSWGRVEHLVSNGMTLQKRSVTKDLFASAKISAILKQVLEDGTLSQPQRQTLEAKKNDADYSILQAGLSQTTNSGTMTISQQPLAPVLTQPRLTIAYRSVTCSSAYYPYPGPTAANLGECCATLCQDTTLIATVGITSTADCCGHCNEEPGGCPLTTANPLTGLATVHLVPYGYVEGSPIPVVI